MKMNKTSVPKSISDNLIDLYTRIPDYSEVQHLGQSDFINTLERLKEEFRQCRASLYNEEFCSDSEQLADKSSPINGRSRTSDNLYYYSSSKFVNNSNENRFAPDSTGGSGGQYGLALTFSEDGHGKISKINNHNVTSTVGLHDVDGDKVEDRTGAAGGGQYLSIKSCELHRTPYRSASASSLVQPTRNLAVYGRSPFPDNGKNDSAFQDDDYDDDEDDDEGFGIGNLKLRDNDRERSVGSSNSDMSISKWSSSPEIYRSRSRSKEFLPPSNVQGRLLQRKSQNNSAPSVAFKEDQSKDVPKPAFKANPVPDHVYKPLYEFIMLKNQRRSERIREQSKRRLLSQVKPFSFCNKDQKKCASSSGNKGNRSMESLNNTKPLKKRRNDTLGNIKTNNNRLSSSLALFKAKPAPPRTKALLAAIKQKEQQEYRELKKRLRAELLLKNASLSPSMAAREKRTKLTNAKIDEVLLDYQKSFADRKNKSRNYRETSTGTDDTALLTDDDRMTEDDFLSGTNSTKKVTTLARPFKFSQRSPRKFTSFGTSRHSAAATGVFEASSNDNHASRLRYQAAKIKEQSRMEREEEEMLRIIRAERRRQKLRDAHLHAWQHASSYSAEQDIAMRRQLRHAASILERETFVRDMSCMLSRVRSAPLLLEGGHRLERKKEPCRKHRDEFQKLTSSGSGAERPWNKLSTPRLYGADGGNKHHHHRHHSALDRYGGGGDEKSETAALAEGSLSNSDNESDDDDDDDGGGHREHRKRVDLLVTDSGSSDLEEDDFNNGRNGDVRVRKKKDRGETAKNKFEGSRENNPTNHADGQDEAVVSVDNDIDDEVGEDDDDDGEEDQGGSGGGNNGKNEIVGKGGENSHK